VERAGQRQTGEEQRHRLAGDVEGKENRQGNVKETTSETATGNPVISQA
jgi:hypothetical protein